jgi:Methylmalonyl-CoA mutase, N-terminal domain/subunit
MVEFTTREMPRWYPISISGYHIGEAGSTPVQQAAYTLSNGFAYVEMFAARGIPVDQFGPRLSFFLDCGLDAEYIALARVSRRIWASECVMCSARDRKRSFTNCTLKPAGARLSPPSSKIISPAPRPNLILALYERH